MGRLDKDVVLWRTDADDRLAYLSRNAADLLGIEPLDVYGNRPRELWRERSRFAWPLSLRQPFSGKHLRIRRPDGDRIELINSGRPNYVDGRFRGFIGMLDVDQASSWSGAQRAATDFDDFVTRFASILEFAQATHAGITCVMLSSGIDRSTFESIAGEALLTCTNSHCYWVVLPAREGPPRQYAFCDRLADARFAIFGEAPVRHKDAVYWLCQLWQELAASAESVAAPSPDIRKASGIEELLRQHR